MSPMGKVYSTNEFKKKPARILGRGQCIPAELFHSWDSNIAWETLEHCPCPYPQIGSQGFNRGFPWSSGDGSESWDWRVGRIGSWSWSWLSGLFPYR